LAQAGTLIKMAIPTATAESLLSLKLFIFQHEDVGVRRIFLA
jgi:hypothetical protein